MKSNGSTTMCVVPSRHRAARSLDLHYEEAWLMTSLWRSSSSMAQGDVASVLALR
jgi:hypothetical protein